MIVYNKQSLYMWHVDRFVTPNEKLRPEHRAPVADFHWHNGRWILINRKLPNLKDITERKDVPIGDAVELTEGKQILLSNRDGGRLAIVQLVHGTA